VEAFTRAGKHGDGPEIGAAVRDLVRATYLRPLRDAEAELSPGRLSRLSQILGAHKNIEGQEKNDFDAANPTNIPENLVGLMAFAQHHLGKHDVIGGVEKAINTQYLKEFAFAGDHLASRIRIAPDLSLQAILEKFELSLQPKVHITPDERCARGLGYNNALFMATELVLLSDGDELALLLIEEPEAHLHPQLQERVQLLLEKKSSHADQGKRPVQVVMTTHSPSLAAGADIAHLTLVSNGQLFPLGHGQTRLKTSDYEFLRRFIDATKANLFFARGVAIVEGPAEALLLPALAKACGRSFSDHGVSIVNVGGVGLYHYARILQRADDKASLPIPVACLTDRDVVPDAAADYVVKATAKRFDADYTAQELADLVKAKEARAQGGSTIVCVSDHWTFEYDLARHGCAELMYCAIALAKAAKAKDELLEEKDELVALATAHDEWAVLQTAGHADDKLAALIYQPLHEKKASKAVCAQYAAHLLATKKYGAGDDLFDKLPPYLRRALQHLAPKAKAP
jgi:putative ATP-dependent endonuclease of OLD family